MSDQILKVTDKVTLLTVFRGEKGDPGDGSSIAIHENSPTSHPDIRTTLNLKASPYTHTQNTLSTSWVVNHNLDKYPSVTIIRDDGSTVTGSIIYNGYNTLSIVFAVAISGTVYCV